MEAEQLIVALICWRVIIHPGDIDMDTRCRYASLVIAPCIGVQSKLPLGRSACGRRRQLYD